MKSMLNALKLLGDPTRLRIIHLLDRAVLNVAELQEILGMGQSRISTQLSQLRREGLVSDSRNGRSVAYSLSAPEELVSLVREAMLEITEAESDLAGLHLVLDRRKDLARAYFDSLAGKFGREYVPGRSWKALAEAMLSVFRADTVADLGAGEGYLSQLLARRCGKVIALDSSEKMVDFGTRLACEHGIANLEYRLGDIQNPPIAPESLDLAIFSQSLHHAELPQKALQATAKCLKPGGQIIILDLVHHGIEQARELYADRWLGFTPAEMFQLMQHAGFSDIHVTVADREAVDPHFQTLLATGVKPA